MNNNLSFIITGKKPEPILEYEYISDIPFYKMDLITIGKMNKAVTDDRGHQNRKDVELLNHQHQEQSRGSQNALINGQNKYHGLNDQKADEFLENRIIQKDVYHLHDLIFSDDVLSNVQKINDELNKKIPEGEPDFVRYPSWLDHPDITKHLTGDEREEINEAKRQREYRRSLAYQFEDLSHIKMPLAKDKMEIFRINRWLCYMIDQLPPFVITGQEEVIPYRNELDFVKKLKVRKPNVPKKVA